jgi:hypothetical protein
MHARAAETEVVVRYERTSLSPESDALVTQMAAQDRGESPVWARQVNTYLAAAAPCSGPQACYVPLISFAPGPSSGPRIAR